MDKYTYPLAITDPSGTLYQPTAKYLFRNELIKLSCDSIEKVQLRMQFIFMTEWQLLEVLRLKKPGEIFRD